MLDYLKNPDPDFFAHIARAKDDCDTKDILTKRTAIRMERFIMTKKKNSSQHKKKGRPTKYDPDIHPDEAYDWMSKFGFTIDDLAKAMKVAQSTIYNWQELYPDFLEAIKKGRDDFDSGNVESALLRRAMGYDYEEKVYATDRKTGVEYVKERKLKHMPPDPLSGIMWLTNRQPGRWKHARHLKVEGPSSGRGKTMSDLLDQICKDIPGDLTDPGPEFTKADKSRWEMPERKRIGPRK